MSIRRDVSTAFFTTALCVLLSVLGATTSLAADPTETAPADSSPGLVGKGVSFAASMGRDLTTQATYPFRLARDHPFLFTAGVAGFAALVATDHATHEFLSPSWAGPGTAFLRNEQKYSAAINPVSTIAVVGGFGAIGLLAHSQRELDTAELLVRSIASTGVWIELLKLASGRERPRQTLEFNADWTGPGRVFADDTEGNHDLASFPSGHSGGAWTVAAVLAHQYPWHGIVPILAYTGAAGMSYSRVVVDAHWLSDVVVGGLIGYGCARQVISSHERRRASQVGWHLVPDIGMRHSGVALTFDW